MNSENVNRVVYHDQSRDVGGGVKGASRGRQILKNINVIRWQQND